MQITAFSRLLQRSANNCKLNVGYIKHVTEPELGKLSGVFLSMLLEKKSRSYPSTL